MIDSLEDLNNMMHVKVVRNNDFLNDSGVSASMEIVEITTNAIVY